MTKTLEQISEAMRKIDFTMLTTVASDGGLASRPMSNNQDVDYDGDSYFFSLGDTDTVREIEANPRVGLTLHGNSGILGKPPLFIAAAGTAEIIRDKAAFKEHWTKDIERWAKDGIDTPGLVMIQVKAVRVHYWDGTDEGEVAV